MNPAVIIISDDDGDDERNMNEDPDVVLISSDEDDDYERNLNEQKDGVLIPDDDNGDELVVNDVEKAVEEVGFDNCNDVVDSLHQGNNDLPELSFDECKRYLRKYGMRLYGTKEDCIQRIIEHVRLIDDRGVSLYPRSSFSINCTGDACKGDVVMFKQKSYNSLGKKKGRRTVAGRIVKESYSESNQQHTFSVEVLWCKGAKRTEKLNPLSILLVQGCDLYKFGTFRQPWTCEAERAKVVGEKHSRGNAFRHKRKLKQTDFASNNNKCVKRQKKSYKGPFQSKLPTQIVKSNPKRQCADSVEEGTSTNSKKAVTLRFQKTKSKRLKDRRVNLLYPRSSFSINCTGDVCKGDVVLFKQQSINQGENLGKKITIAGRIVKESYGGSKQQHTFTVKVLWTKHSINPPPFSTLFVRGCNLYRFGTFRQPWKNEAERLVVLEEKHKRGRAARHKISLRLAQISSTNDKGGNGQMVSYKAPSQTKQTARLVKLKFSKKRRAALAMPQKKSTQPTHQPKPNPSLIKQQTQTDQTKFSKKPLASLVKESEAAHKKAAVQSQKTEFNNMSTQPPFHQEPNPNCSMYSNHNLQEAQPPFPYYPNLNPDHSMYSNHNLQEASPSFPYYPNPNPNPNPNHSMYSNHDLQVAALLSLWSLSNGYYNNGQWGPNNDFYQPPGQYGYGYEQPGYYPYNR